MQQLRAAALARFLDTASVGLVLLPPRGPESLLLRVPRGPVPHLPLAPGPRPALLQRRARLLGAVSPPRRARSLARVGDLQLRRGNDARAGRSRILRRAAHQYPPRPPQARPAPQAREPRLPAAPDRPPRAVHSRHRRPAAGPPHGGRPR